ncbi:MAG: hypothetical protein QN163_04895 [Armatimonadota bacterium]|nr:hypothetical protein [Armatimonadota bacterium]MDR5696095.1 hypothetical protein [Armatimonadota bacterium]
MRVSRIVGLMLTLVVAASFPFAVWGQENGEELIVARIKAVYGEDFEDLDGLIETMRDAGYGWGEVIMALHLAKLSGKSVEEIMEMRASGMGWGEIAMELGVHPSQLGLAVAYVMSEGKSPQNAGKPETTPGGPPSGTPGGPPSGVPGKP